VLLFAALLFLAAFFIHRPFMDGNASTVANFEKKLHQKEMKLNDEMRLLAGRVVKQNYNQLFAQKPFYYNNLFQKEGIVMLIYENDTLKFWSDNSVAVENWRKEVCLDTKLVKLHNGWFEVMKPEANGASSKTIVGLILIKSEYPYQNKYLVNEFQKSFALPADTKLDLSCSDIKNQVKKYNNEPLFCLEFDPANNSVGFTSYLALLLNLLGFLFVVIFLKKWLIIDHPHLTEKQQWVKHNYSLLLLSSILIALRYITIKFSLPGIFYEFNLFSPKIYADASSVWLNSLGDLWINSIILFFLTYTLCKEFEIKPVLLRLKKVNQFVLSFFCFQGFFFLSWVISTLFIGLIKNSNIPFSINNLFTLNQYSYVALLIIGLLLFVCFLLADKIVEILKQFNLTNQQYFIAFLIAAIIHSSLWQLLGILDLILILWPFVLIIVIALIKRGYTGYYFSAIVFLVFIFSLFSVHVFIKHTGIKEIESRKRYAEKLAAEQDPVAEFLFQDIQKKISNDTVLTAYLNGSEKQLDEFEKRLKQDYFSGFWEKYDVKIALFDNMCAPVIKSQNSLFDNTLYFDDLIDKKGVSTTSPYLFFINNVSGKIKYLAKLTIKSSHFPISKIATLYIELDAKYISDEIGFPELLLDKNVGMSQELTNYSYAKYKHNQLISQNGKFPYNRSGLIFYTNQGNYTTINKENYSHLLYRPDVNTLIIISKKNDGIIAQVSNFSYLFALFSLLLLIILFFRQVMGGSLFENFNFKYRIQLLLVLIVLTSLVLFGGGTIYYIKQQFETKNRENISEKIHSVLIDIDSKLSNENVLNKSLSEYSTFVLKKLAYTFFTDINLYDTQGNLYASSRPKVFDEGLTSKKMNPEAYLQMAILGKSEFIHDERIGKLEYLSAYISFKNKEGKVLAYLNLPYFAKQSELEKEISGFLVALINIYVLLFALSIVMAIFISNYVTKPLKLIQDKLSKIKLGTTNELIEWHEKDEIGSLVSEYNRMILELTNSAELLAKSERESAWREMAKQVAHEIKNPLTPMKLSVQHLQRIWKDQTPDMDQKMERLTQTIIEQIDTLSGIATEFSNFAKMPKANVDKVNLNKVILNSISLYSDSTNPKIKFTNETAKDCFVLADKDQLLRVFNNLIKNAIQAIPEGKQGEIEIRLNKADDSYIFSIKDNGLGIAEDVFNKIFVPNFTTKTAGMGLGLAMVKNIVESVEGKIWFESKIDQGATFFVALPCF
jgi:signal transduction histidine kinase